MGDYQDEIGATGACGERPMGETAGQRIAARFNLNHIHFGWLEIAGKIDEAMAETGREWAKRAEAAESHLNNLLAVIHRDGGHYVAQHGLAKAVEDALVLSANRIAAEEKAANVICYRAADGSRVWPEPDRGFVHDERIRQNVLEEVLEWLLTDGSLGNRQHVASRLRERIQAASTKEPPILTVESLECECGWTGSEADCERVDEPADDWWYRCPKCGEMTAHVPLDELPREPGA